MKVLIWLLVALGGLPAAANLGFFVFGQHRPENLAVGLVCVLSTVALVVALRSFETARRVGGRRG